MAVAEPKAAFSEWCVLELMGHRKLAGLVTEQQIAGQGFLRLDIYKAGEPLTLAPQEDSHVATQFYSPSSVYCITPCSEDTARAFATAHQIQPVSRWELPQLEVATARRGEPDGVEEYPF